MDEKISGTSFTRAEEQELIRLLGKVKQDSYHWPTEAAMRAAHSVVSYWAPELVISRKSALGGDEILLARYDGGVEEFQGKWHLPGGYNRWDESISETCHRIAHRELGVADVKVYKVLGACKWGDDHPYGHPLSVYINCLTTESIFERDDLRFFSPYALPADMVEVGPHRLFINKLFG